MYTATDCHYSQNVAVCKVDIIYKGRLDGKRMMKNSSIDQFIGCNDCCTMYGDGFVGIPVDKQELNYQQLWDQPTVFSRKVENNGWTAWLAL